MEAGQWIAMHPFNGLSVYFGGHFLSLAVCYGIIPYIQAKANKGCLVQKFYVNEIISFSANMNLRLSGSTIHPLLMDSICLLHTLPRNSRYGDVHHNSVSTVKCLLSKGADPNAKSGSFRNTVWENFKFVYVAECNSKEWLEESIQISVLMIQHGAGDFSKKQRKKVLDDLEAVRNPLPPLSLSLHRRELCRILSIQGPEFTPRANVVCQLGYDALPTWASG